MVNIKKKTITTIGVVIPVEWEENGKPVSFALSSYEEKEYLIDSQTTMGKKLSKIEKQKIRVTGSIGKIINNRYVLTVANYEPLVSPESK